MSATPKGTPALNEGEWAEMEFDAHYCDTPTSVHIDHKGRIFVHENPDGSGDRVIIVNQADDNGRARHALAALALWGTPEGFTHGDVQALDDAYFAIGGLSERIAIQLGDIRARIEALLPPEAP